MRGDKSNIMPIMTNSESIYQFGANAYGKPTVALNILRDTIMGRELFDFAFKEYSKTWMFKHPTPSDFFRIMENASCVGCLNIQVFEYSLNAKSNNSLPIIVSLKIFNATVGLP